MKTQIIEKLNQIASQQSLHWLHVAESGSRAWGFASPDSDYDVRAIYICPSDVYLSIQAQKDTFEYIENQWFDVGGWDIRKALNLLRKSNAVLLEWLSSPIIYAQDPDFIKQLHALLPDYVQAAPLLHHYRGIAHNALKTLDFNQEIRLKKWFYVLRPLLAARWAIQQGGVPPMVLHDLMRDWQPEIHQEILDLIALKSTKEEQYHHRLSPTLRHATEQLINEVNNLTAPDVQLKDIEPLNELFRQTLKRCHG